MGEGGRMRVAVDWRRVRLDAGHGSDAGRYQRALTVALASTAQPGDEVWALIARPDAADVIGPGIGHAGVGRHGRDRAAMLRALGAGAAVFAHELPGDVTTPSAVVMHDVLPLTHPEWTGRDGRSRGATIAALRDAPVLIVPSQVARIDALSVAEVPEDRVLVVPPTVAPEFTVRPATAARDRSRRGLGRYCVALGDASPRGNLGHLVVPPTVAPEFTVRPATAARDRSRRGLGRYCVALGDASPRGNLGHLADAVRRIGGGVTVVSPLAPPRRARHTDGVLFVGPLTDAGRADLLAGAAWAAAVGFADGCGLGVLEALASGVPVVVSDRGALAEAAGAAALVVPPTVNAIAEGIRALGDAGIADALREAGPRRAEAYRADRTGPAAWAACARLCDGAVRTAA